MKKYVLDSYALLSYCENEKGADKVTDILTDSLNSKAIVLISLINFGEMYYISLREGGKSRAEKYKNTIENYPVEIINPDIELTLKASRIKAFKKMSYADCFAAALAEHENAILVTGDDEFKEVEKSIKILWI